MADINNPVDAEGLKVAALGAVNLTGGFHLSDAAPVASLDALYVEVSENIVHDDGWVEATSGDVVTAWASEAVGVEARGALIIQGRFHVQDQSPPQAEKIPFQFEDIEARPEAEGLKSDDDVPVASIPGVAASAAEGLKIAYDTVDSIEAIDPSGETICAADSGLQATTDPSIAVQETARLADGQPIAYTDPKVQVASELSRVRETTSASLNPLAASTSERPRVDDQIEQPQLSTGGTLWVAPEGLKAADQQPPSAQLSEHMVRVDSERAWLSDVLAVAAAYVPVAASIMVKVYVSGAWLDITRDVLANPGIATFRGIQGNGPSDRLASTGTMNFSLRNDNGNVARLEGYYSPVHANTLPDWGRGTPVRLLATYLGNVYPLWRGKVRTVDPVPGRHGTRRVDVVAYDAMADLSDFIVREVSPQVLKTEVELQEAIIASMPEAARPVASAYDTALDTYPYAFFDLGEGEDAVSVVQRILASCQGYAYVGADGTYRYMNRHSMMLGLPALTLDDSTMLERGPGLSAPSNLDAVYNRVRMSVHAPALGDVTTDVIYSLPAPIELAAGQSIEVWGTYTDPDNTVRLMGGTDFQAVVAGADYVANSADDGSGDDLTSSVSVTAWPFAATVLFELSNTNENRTIYVTTLQQRGRKIIDVQPIWVESYTAANYGNRTLDVDLVYQSDLRIAQDLADYLAAQYIGREIQPAEVAINPQQSHDLMVAALSLDFGDVISATETMTGLDDARVHVLSIAHEITVALGGAAMLTTRFGVGPHEAATAFILDQTHLDAEDAVLGYA